MGEHEAPKRWILITMLQHAIERTEAEIAELKANGLFARDATPEEVAVAPATPSAFFTPAAPAPAPEPEPEPEPAAEPAAGPPAG